MLAQAITDKDTSKMEFLLRTISYETIPLLFNNQSQWVQNHNRHNSGHSFLDTNVMIDRVMDMMTQVGEELDWIFEVYANNKFGLPDIVKKRFTWLHDFSKDYSHSNTLQSLYGNSYVNILYGDYKSGTFFGNGDFKA
jgi:hypothetical protein